MLDITCFSPSLNLLCLITNSHTVIKTFIRPQHDGWKIEKKLISQKNICDNSYFLDNNDNKLYYFTCVLRTKFCVPDSNRFTELAAVRKSFNNFLLPLLLFTQHQLVHAKLIHTSTEKQKNTIQFLFLSFFSPMAINNFIDKNANDPLNRTCESIHHFHNCPQPTLFTLRSISATPLLREEHGLILPNSEKNSSKTSFL